MWLNSPLGDLAEIISGGTPSRNNEAYWGGDIPWVTPTDITACHTNCLTITADSITTAGFLHSSAKMLPAGSILLTSRATIGISKIASVPVCTNQGFKSLVPSSKINRTYLFYQVQQLKGAFERFAAGSTFLEINKKDTARVSISYPNSLLIQEKIAAVLSEIDNTIEKTNAVIAKYQQIKAGLMQDLFTRGVMPNGQLRPTREQAPELYQETTIGWVPKEWKVQPLNEKVNPLRPICYGILMPGYGHHGGVPVVKVKDIRDRSIDEKNLLLTSPAIDLEYKRSRLKAGDVLFTIRGTVGRIAIVPQHLEKANITQDTARIDLFGIKNTFISYYFETETANRFIKINTLGVAVQGINLSELRKLPIPVPPEAEQGRISDRIDSILKKIDAEVVIRNKLASQKLGLMQDLLTGKVQVTVDEPEPAHA